MLFVVLTLAISAPSSLAEQDHWFCTGGNQFFPPTFFDGALLDCAASRYSHQLFLSDVCECGELSSRWCYASGARVGLGGSISGNSQPPPPYFSGWERTGTQSVVGGAVN